MSSLSKTNNHEKNSQIALANQKLKKALELSKTLGDKQNIGIQGEHTLHRVIKFYIKDDLLYHEIPIGRRYADVKIDNDIYEIQTKNFNLLKDKLKAFLVDFDVYIVHPYAYKTHFYLTNDYGELIKERTSPKHLHIFNVMRELYRIKEYLKNDKLHFIFMEMEMDEYRNTIPIKTFRGKGYERNNQVPLEILNIYEINDYHDWNKVLDEYELPDGFTLKEFRKIVHVDERSASITLHILCYLGLMERFSKRGNSYLYHRI